MKGRPKNWEMRFLETRKQHKAIKRICSGACEDQGDTVLSILCAHRNIFVITLADKSDEISLDEYIVLIGSPTVCLAVGPPFCHLGNLFCGSHSRKNCLNIWSVKEQMEIFLKPQVTMSHFLWGHAEW
ncbi:unnamed protein product [Rangifer tarandus platyrhynchus]|uniref:Uncharacterized protein n=2 Tax=Rangifer tarandus platyrhynchus TaxID=3082113 RepID=A0ABN8Z5X2_RANTA|nr:unnamed protein product [Rangifer tarandus platyrhynchus]